MIKFLNVDNTGGETMLINPHEIVYATLKGDRKFAFYELTMTDGTKIAIDAEPADVEEVLCCG